MIKQNKSNTRTAWLLAMLLTTLLIGCDDDDVEVDKNSPAQFLAESEQSPIPDEVALPGNFERVATYYAKGFQIYTAQPVEEGGAGTYRWVFSAPSAALYDDKGQVGGHYAGPSWELSDDNHSKIVCQAFTPSKSKNVDPNSIDWLLLKPKDGTIPTGIFAGVSHVQRILTVGGKAPATPPTGPGESIGVAYTAIYRFSKSN